MNADEWTGYWRVTFANKALDVEVFVLHSQDFAFTRFATVLTWGGAALSLALLLVKGTVNSLLVKRCGENERRRCQIQTEEFTHPHTHTYTVYIFKLWNIEMGSVVTTSYITSLCSKQHMSLLISEVNFHPFNYWEQQRCSHDHHRMFTKDVNDGKSLLCHMFNPSFAAVWTRLHTYSITKACKLFIIQPTRQLEKDLQPLVLKGRVKLVSVGHPIPFWSGINTTGVYDVHSAWD